jgi:hypothetical protein
MRRRADLAAKKIQEGPIHSESQRLSRTRDEPLSPRFIESRDDEGSSRESGVGRLDHRSAFSCKSVVDQRPKGAFGVDVPSFALQESAFSAIPQA